MTCQGGGFEHIDTYAYATAPSQQGSLEQRQSVVMGVLLQGPLTEKDMQLAPLYNDDDSLENPLPLMFLPSPIMHVFIDCTCAHSLVVGRHMQHIQQCSRDGFFRFYQTMLDMNDSKEERSLKLEWHYNNKASHWLTVLSGFQYSKCWWLFVASLWNVFPQRKAGQCLIFQWIISSELSMVIVIQKLKIPQRPLPSASFSAFSPPHFNTHKIHRVQWSDS